MAGSAQRSRGLYRLLERPAVFNRLMRLLGGDSVRERIVRDFLPPLTGATLLDIGCGTGAFLDALPPDVSYVGVDINPAYIETARRRYGNRGQFYCARAGDEIDFAGDAFDVIAAIAVIHHLDDAEVSRLLETAVRLLRPGGTFLSIDPTKHAGQSAPSRLLVSLDRGRCVRTPAAYRALLASRFADIDDRVVTDLLRIPYSHYVAQARSASVR
jgi:SAM-dependent methyltransferase